MPNSNSAVIYSKDNKHNPDVIHATVSEYDFPLKINFRGQVYDLIKTAQGKLRLGKESEERKYLLTK